MAKRTVDRSFVIALIALLAVGVLIFISASFGLLAKNEAQYSSIAFNQLFFGVGLGLFGCYLASRIPYKFWKKYAFVFLGFAVILNLLVFVPGLGLEHGGGRRWLAIGNYSFQPGEVLKIACIFAYAALLSIWKDKVASFRFGILPLIFMIGLGVSILLLQSDTDLILPTALTAMFLVAGGRWRDIGILALIGAIALGGLVATKPYIKQRIMTFINPASDSLNSGYQIQQSLIAIGSGQLTGRGFGQSIQKFNYLPEPVGDSIFAVAAEEFGFVGSVLLIILFSWFSIRGLKIASETNDSFGRLIAVGIVILICAQSFMNIGAMLGIIPLTGVPLVFVSHGGTSILISLFSAGIVLAVSRGRKTA